MNIGFTIHDIVEELFNFKENILDSKKYWIIYLIFILIASISMLSFNNFEQFSTEFLTLILVSVLGIICVTYAVSYYSDENLYKIAFVIIVVFGLVCAFMMPICEPSDTDEHLTRAEITSRGILFPEYTGNSFSSYYLNGSDYVWTGGGFETISSINDFSLDRFTTIYTAEHIGDKINNTPLVVNQAAEQNPFFGYLPQALGVFVAKLLDLSPIWMMWLARIANLMCYAGIVSYAVKKTPIFKIPMIVTACLPMSMFQGASVSIDSMIIALGIFLIAYFFEMCMSEEKSITNQDIVIFMLLSLVTGLLKLTYLGFAFLIFAVPSKNFKNSNASFYCFIGILILGVIGVSWSRFATDALWHSFRAVHFLKENVNSTQQLSFILSNPINPILLLSQFLNSLNMMTYGTFLVYPPGPHGGGYNSASGYISSMIPLFMGCVYLAYPNAHKFKLKSKLGALFVMFIVYMGTCFAEFLAWTPSGQILATGLSPRYFLPLYALVPFIFGINFADKRNVKFDYYILTLTISFLALMIIAFAFGFY